MILLRLPVSAQTLMRLLLSVLLIESYAVWRRRHTTSFWVAGALLLLTCGALCALLLPLS